MQLNQATDYAFRVVLYLAGLPSGTVESGVVIAESQNIPYQFLQKIMRMLAAAGLVQSYRGVEGGFALAKLPDDITLYDVITAMEGPIAIQRCLSDRNACNKGYGRECPVHRALQGIQDRLAADLSKVTFAALAAEAKN